MVNFPNELASQLVVTDNSGNRIIQIGPQPNITVNGLNGTKIILGIEPSTMRPALLFYDASNNLKGFMVYDPVADNTFVGGPGGGISLTAGGDYFVDDTGNYGVFQNSGAPAFLQYYNNGNIEVWNTFTPGNGWTLTDSFGFKLMPDGTVQFRGSLKYGTTTDGTVIGTLPSGYHPLTNTEFVCSTTGGATWNKIAIATDGTIRFFNGNGVPGGGVVMVTNIRFATL